MFPSESVLVDGTAIVDSFKGPVHEAMEVQSRSALRVSKY